jgi:deoxyribose-phosphate aldolase
MTPTQIREVAKLIDHALLHPTLTDAEMRAGCKLALTYDVASVCIKPYGVALANDLLAGSDVLVGTVIGFPHGHNTIRVKVEEARQACQDGAVELDMVVNIGKVLGENWAYVTEEIRAIQDICHAHGAILKVIFENDFLPGDSSKIRLCEICTEIGVAFVKTSTGFGFVKGKNGLYDYMGATLHDLHLMLSHVGPAVHVKASGGIRTLDDVLTMKNLGIARIGTSATATIMTEAYRRSGIVTIEAPGPISIDTKGY